MMKRSQTVVIEKRAEIRGKTEEMRKIDINIGEDH